MPAVWMRSRKPSAITSTGCSTVGCGHAAANRCAYVDQWSWRCAEPCCEQHSRELSGTTYCARHAGYYLALGGNRPPLAGEFDDPYRRRPSLATWLPRDLDADVRRLLAAVGETDVANVEMRQAIHATETESILWETRWHVADASPLLTLSLVTEAYRDPTLVARVGSMVVLREVPEWLRHHLYGSVDGESDKRLRRELFRRLHNAMGAAFRGGEEIEIELPGWSYLVLSPGDR